LQDPTEKHLGDVGILDKYEDDNNNNNNNNCPPYATNQSFPILATNHVLIMLRFLATDSFLQVTGNTTTGADKSTVSHIVCGVTLAIAHKT
jgi:uncharacterized Fe-S cluster-containing radical SAM superfamily protein